jgi:hypothetical protein
LNAQAGTTVSSELETQSNLASSGASGSEVGLTGKNETERLTRPPLVSTRELASARGIASATEEIPSEASTGATVKKPTSTLLSGQTLVQNQPSEKVSAVRATAATAASAEVGKAPGNPDGSLTVADTALSSTDGEGSAILPVQGQSSLAQSSPPIAVRGSGPTAGGGSSTQTTQHKSLEVQSVGLTVDAAGAAREVAGLQNATHSTYSETARTSTASASIGEPFAALDSAGSTASPTWTHAGAHQAEAGYQDPVLGWVSVRAESSGGGIRAALVPGSEEAGQALGGHLAGLNAYLAEHHATVETVTVAAPEQRGAGAGMEQGSNQSMNQDMNQGAGQQTADQRRMGAESGFGSSSLSGSSVQSAAQSSSLSSAAAVAASTVQTTGTSGGVHISVMA